MQNVKLLQDLQNRALCGEELVDLLPELANAEYLASLANETYRSGDPIIEDWFYDQYLIEALKALNPESDFLREVEPEPVEVFGKTVPLPEPMLSTQKAYSVAEIEKWAENVLAVGQELGLPSTGINFKVTPKLDGFAAYDDGETFYTRGNGVRGTDITRAFDRGLRTLISPSSPRYGEYGRGFGKGEIVVDKSYFEKLLAGKYENSRNVIAAVIKEGELDEEIKTAILCGAIVFAPFENIDSRWLGSPSEIAEGIDRLWELLVDNSEFDTDGLVFETTSLAIKSKMGSTNHHHRWQIAYKRNTEFHDIRVTGLTWQTGKSGKITPVVELEPTKVSGVTISRATGHHYGNVISRWIGIGAVVRVCRSGQVIPYITEVVKPATHMLEPYTCPSCGSPTEIRGDFLHCTNESTCPAQVERTIEHFFKTIGNCDGFGPKIIEQLCAGGLNSVPLIYGVELISDLTACGIGEGIAINLFSELLRSQNEQIEDWRFLAAFSIPSVGKGGCERLLKHHRIEDIFSLSADDIIRIDGFAEKTASILVETLRNIKPQFDMLFPLFNLKRTEIGFDAIVDQMKSGSPIAGKTIVFTGTMTGKREFMEQYAKSLGAKVGSSVSSKTDYLVAGLNVGANKTAAAEKHGVKVLSEDEYLQLIEP